MAKIFLDTNVFIDYIEQRKPIDMEVFEGHEILISPLSVHILIYVRKHKIPHTKLNQLIENFSLISFNVLISQKSLQGPTKDFEDNVQLHSAAEAECDYFLTSDKKLLSMKFFGRTKIDSQMAS